MQCGDINDNILVSHEILNYSLKDEQTSLVAIKFDSIKILWSRMDLHLEVLLPSLVLIEMGKLDYWMWQSVLFCISN